MTRLVCSQELCVCVPCMCVWLSTGSKSYLRLSDEFAVIRPAGSTLLILQLKVVVESLLGPRETILGCLQPVGNNIYSSFYINSYL